MPFTIIGRTKIPFDMFDLDQSAKEARRAEKLGNIYHRGQELAWDGRKVLGQLLAKHGGIHLPADQAQALNRLFGILMWGEMAAWKISAELADRLVPLQAKMAASSQVHDEARHFYVLHDYLKELGHVPTTIDRSARVVLDLVLNTDDLCEKLMGMQLLIETLALTLFQAVREAQVEPVLCELLRYFEKDEARHVGLGLQFLPTMLKGMSRARASRLVFSEAHLLVWAMAELKAIEPDLRIVGLDPRRIFTLGLAKQALAFQGLWTELGGPPGGDDLANRILCSLGEVLFPQWPTGQAPTGFLAGTRHRLRAALHTFRSGIKDMPASSLDPEAPQVHPAPLYQS